MELLHRSLTGAHQQPPPALTAREHASGKRREQPARKGPTTSRYPMGQRCRGSRRRRVAPARRRAAHAQRSSPVDGLEARQALERADALGGDPRGRRRPRQGPHLFARGLEIRHPAGKLELHLGCLPRRRRRVRRRRRAARSPRRLRTASAARANSRQLSYCCSGSFANARASTASRAGGRRTAARSPAAAPSRGAQRPRRAASSGGMAAARRGTRRGRSRANRRPRVGRHPLRRSVPERRSRSPSRWPSPPAPGSSAVRLVRPKSARYA